LFATQTPKKGAVLILCFGLPLPEHQQYQGNSSYCNQDGDTNAYNGHCVVDFGGKSGV